MCLPKPGTRIRLIAMPDDPERRTAAGNMSRVIRDAHWRDEPRDASNAEGDTTRRNLPAQVLCPAGSEGVVVEATDGPLAQIIVEWIGLDRSLSLVPGVDIFEIVAQASENQDAEEPS